MDQLPTLPFADFGADGFSSPNLALSAGFLQIIFFISIILTIVFTLVLFGHWKKYAPNPLKAFGYGVVYLIGAGALIIGQLALLSMY